MNLLLEIVEDLYLHIYNLDYRKMPQNIYLNCLKMNT